MQLVRTATLGVVPTGYLAAVMTRPPFAARRRLREIDALMVDYARPRAPGASVTAIRRGHVVLCRSYGLAVVETGMRSSDRTTYRLASLTKQFTAAAIMMLAREGRVQYDEPVMQRLPGVPRYASAVTIRHLLTHTSGLVDYEDFVPAEYDGQLSDRDVLAILQRAPGLAFDPGSRWQYSNSGYAMLALVVEHAAGVPFARFLRERIFAPLGMMATVGLERGISSASRRAYGYTAVSPGFARTDQSATSAVLGDGGIYSSVRDIARWVRALDGGTVLDAAALRDAWTPVRLAGGDSAPYGFGWFVESDAAGQRLWHHGETVGFTNGIVRYPDRGLTVVVLTNRTGGTPWEAAARIAEQLGG